MSEVEAVVFVSSWKLFRESGSFYFARFRRIVTLACVRASRRCLLRQKNHCDATRDGRTMDVMLEDPQLGVTSRKRLADTIDKETG